MNKYALSEAKLAKSHDASSGSTFCLNEIGYMNVAYWIIATKHSWKGIHTFLVILCFIYLFYLVLY